MHLNSVSVQLSHAHNMLIHCNSCNTADNCGPDVTMQFTVRVRAWSFHNACNVSFMFGFPSESTHQSLYNEHSWMQH